MQNTGAITNIYEMKAFQNLSATSKNLLERGLQYYLYAQKKQVLHKGQSVSGAYIVVSGQLRVYTLAHDGTEATLYLINPGESCVLALNCIFNDLLYPAWVEAVPGTHVAMIPGQVFKTLFESETAIRNLTIQALSTVVFRLMSDRELIHTYKLEHRLANFLLLHANTAGCIKLTQQEIASHLGTTREVIARAIGQLVATGHIQTHRNKIVINNPAALAKSLQQTNT